MSEDILDEGKKKQKPKRTSPKFRITQKHRRQLIYYLNEFYGRYPAEKFTVFHFVKYFKARLKNNKDAWMGVSGETGVGKSLLVLMSMILFGRAMNLEDNVTYIPTGDEIVDKFNKLSFNCLLVDEAAKDMRSINWQKKSQQGVTTKAQTDRFKNNWIFLNMPNFNEFTKSLKQTSIKFRAVVLYRTKAHARVVIHMKSRNWRDDDPWGDKIANDRYKNAQRRNREITNEVMLDIERTLPNTVMDFLIPNLELILPDVTDEYERLKIESRLNEDEDPVMSAKRNIWKEKYEQTMATIAKTLYHNDMNLGKMSPTKTEIANKLNISTATLNKFIDMDTKRFEKSRGLE